VLFRIEVRLDHPEILVRTARNLREDVGGVLVAEVIRLIDGVAHPLAVSSRARAAAINQATVAARASRRRYCAEGSQVGGVYECS
jgi:hypothetical protein